jgi:hypothetical protein
MAKYVYIYKGGHPSESEEEGNRLRAAWMAFVGGLGDSVVDGGNQFGASKSVGNATTSGMTGYTVISTASMGEAVAKAQPCPIFEMGGDVEVYEAIEM